MTKFEFDFFEASASKWQIVIWLFKIVDVGLDIQDEMGR